MWMRLDNARESLSCGRAILVTRFDEGGGTETSVTPPCIGKSHGLEKGRWEGRDEWIRETRRECSLRWTKRGWWEEMTGRVVKGNMLDMWWKVRFWGNSISALSEEGDGKSRPVEMVDVRDVIINYSREEATFPEETTFQIPYVQCYSSLDIINSALNNSWITTKIFVIHNRNMLKIYIRIKIKLNTKSSRNDILSIFLMG